MPAPPEQMKPVISLSSLFSAACIASAAFLLCLFAVTAPEGHSFGILIAAVGILVGELAVTALVWIAGRRWPVLLSSSWLLFIIVGGMTYAHLSRPDLETDGINFFVSLLTAGYIALRAGCAAGSVSGGGMADRIARSAGNLLPLSDGTGRLNRRLSFLIALVFSAGMLAFFLYFNNFPAFAPNPAVARYLHFNGPYTSGLVRFFYRIFLSGTEISLMMMTYLCFFSDRGASPTLPVADRVLNFTGFFLCMAMLFINASRGPMFRPIIFGILAYARSVTDLRQMIRLAAGMTLILSLLVSYSLYRFTRHYGGLHLQNLGPALYPFFPEVAEGTIVISEFRDYNEPLLWGRTILSGLLVFIPSAMFSFRQDFDINRYTLEIANVQIDSTGGIRITTIGEAYINFGLPGVFLVLMAVGFCLGKITTVIQNAPSRKTFGLIFLATFLATVPVFTSALIFLLYAVVGIGLVQKIAAVGVSSLSAYHDNPAGEGAGGW